MSIGYTVSWGNEILGWNASLKRRVLYIDDELPAPTWQQRLALIVNSFDSEQLENGFKHIIPDLQPNGIVPYLSDSNGRNSINKHAQDVDNHF